MRSDDFTRRLGLEFEQLVGDGEVRVDADAVAAKGSRTLRRRRNLTAIAVAAGVVVLVAGGTLFKLPSASGDRVSNAGSVPVCATATEQVFASKVTDHFDDSGVSSTASMTWTVQSVRPTPGRGTSVAEGSSIPDTPGSTPSPYTLTVPLHTVTLPLPDPPAWFTPEKNRQLDQVATAALPAAIRGDGLSFHNLGGAIGWRFSASSAPMSIATTSVPTVSATAALHSSKASATLVVMLRSGPASRPACSAGPITSRTIREDGTVVDIGPVPTSTLGWTAYAPLDGSSAGTVAPGTPTIETRMNGSANTDSIQVVAYRPDGSVLTVILTDALGHVMTEAQLVDLATAPGLDIVSPPPTGMTSAPTS